MVQVCSFSCFPTKSYKFSILDITLISLPLTESSYRSGISFVVPEKIPSKEQWVSDTSETHCMLCQLIRFSMVSRILFSKFFCLSFVFRSIVDITVVVAAAWCAAIVLQTASSYRKSTQIFRFEFATIVTVTWSLASVRLVQIQPIRMARKPVCWQTKERIGCWTIPRIVSMVFEERNFFTNLHRVSHSAWPFFDYIPTRNNAVNSSLTESVHHFWRALLREVWILHCWLKWSGRFSFQLASRLKMATMERLQNQAKRLSN